MMFGTREEFDYVECGSCGCVWLVTPPADLGRYYGPNYYSLRLSAFSQWVRTNRLAYRLAYLATRQRFPPGLPEWWPEMPARLDAAVLDVGSGTGNLLLHLKYLGFRNLLGVDPFIDHDYEFSGGPRILKTSLDELTDEFDVIVLNHSLEHMPDPGKVFASVAHRLNRGGSAVIRTPMASSYAYRTYGADWIQIDAPRHVLIHTPKSVAILAGHSGLVVTATRFDSTGFQFWGSELYRRGIPLNGSKRLLSTSRKGFSARQMQAYDVAAEELNSRGEGDQATFVLRRLK